MVVRKSQSDSMKIQLVPTQLCCPINRGHLLLVLAKKRAHQTARLDKGGVHPRTSGDRPNLWSNQGRRELASWPLSLCLSHPRSKEENKMINLRFVGVPIETPAKDDRGSSPVGRQRHYGAVELGNTGEQVNVHDVVEVGDGVKAEIAQPQPDGAGNESSSAPHHKPLRLGQVNWFEVYKSSLSVTHAQPIHHTALISPHIMLM